MHTEGVCVWVTNCLATPSSHHLDCLRRAHLLQPLEAQRLAQPIEPEALINQIGQLPILRCSGSCLGLENNVQSLSLD